MTIDWLGLITPSKNFALTASLQYSKSVTTTNGLKTLSVSYTWQNPEITNIILPEPSSPNVSSWVEYHSMRIEFWVSSYINDVQQDSRSYLWLFDGEGESWSPRGNFGDTMTVSQGSENDVIKIVFSGDITCSLFFGSDNTHPSLGIYEERLDYIDDKFVEE